MRRDQLKRVFTNEEIAKLLNRRWCFIRIVGTFTRFAPLLGSCVIFTLPAHAAEDEGKLVTDLVRRFTQAQSAMDAPALAALTAENYIEISPLGEVDPREKMLTFYVKDDKHVLPAMTVDDITTRLLGGTAVVIAKISYSLVSEGQHHIFSLRSTFVAEKIAGVWKLVSAHYTPIHAPKSPG